MGRAIAGTAVEADVFDPRSIAAALGPSATLVHLVGTPHPSPAKAASFLSIDLASIRASVAAARGAGVAHLVYVSVAQPAPVMRAYVEARARGEAEIDAAGLTATILRPWYVLGPGHRWPALLLPLATLAEAFPPTRETARRLGFVTLEQMLEALVQAIERPPPKGRRVIVDVPAIRASGAGGPGEVLIRAAGSDAIARFPHRGSPLSDPHRSGGTTRARARGDDSEAPREPRRRGAGTATVVASVSRSPGGQVPVAWASPTLSRDARLRS